jgi:hypothetical protein
LLIFWPKTAKKLKHKVNFEVNSKFIDMSPANEKIIDQLVNHYNNCNARGFADLFTPDTQVYEQPGILTQQGREEIYEYYEKVFLEFPKNRTKVLHRIVIDNKVIDHEEVRRSPEVAAFYVLAIYEIENGFIKRLDFIRNQSTVAIIKN